MNSYWACCSQLALGFGCLGQVGPFQERSRPPLPCSLPSHVNDGATATNTWPSGIVPYVFVGVSPEDQQRAIEAMTVVQNVAGISFVQRTAQNDYVRIINAADNWSYVGRIGGPQDMHIHDWHSRYTIVHELMHAVGIWHEQQRTDRNQYVQIGNIQAGFEANFAIRQDAGLVGPYDFDSVMHYHRCAFSTCCPPQTFCNCPTSCQTITVLPPYQSWQNLVGQLDHLSAGDIQTLRHLYSPCSGPPSWQSLPGGGPPDWVYALVAFGGELIVGGRFNSNGTPLLAWNGSVWRSIGTVDSIVDALTVYNGELIAGGAFESIGGVVARGVARWDGQTWRPLGSGTTGRVLAFHSFGASLCVGGRFSAIGGVQARNVALWNGSTWQALGAGVGVATSISDQVETIIVDRDTLVVGGDFDANGNNIAYWTGAAWVPLGGGITCLGSTDRVNALAVFGERLYAGGRFTTTNGAPGNHIVWLGGSTPNGSWVRMTGQEPNSTVYDLLTQTDGLVTTGAFTSVANVSNVRAIAKWNGGAWSSYGLGVDNTGHALAVYRSDLVVGGEFTSAGGIPASYIARWGCVPPPPCYANCDDSVLPPVLNVQDFTCFLQRYASGDSYANCDNSTTAPVLNVQDFTCFLQAYAAGCP
jgi:hypothetical protein